MYGLGSGRKHEGRPMVWETCEVREEVSHSQFASLYLPSQLPTNIEKMLRNGNAPPSCILHTAQCSIWLMPCLHTTTTRQNPHPTQFNAPRHTSTSLTCNREPEVVFYAVSMLFASLPPPSHATASRRWFFTLFRHHSHHHHLPHMQP